jgi:hypothetical protein
MGGRTSVPSGSMVCLCPLLKTVSSLPSGHFVSRWPSGNSVERLPSGHTRATSHQRGSLRIDQGKARRSGRQAGWQ